MLTTNGWFAHTGEYHSIISAAAVKYTKLWLAGIIFHIYRVFNTVQMWGLKAPGLTHSLLTTVINSPPPPPSISPTAIKSYSEITDFYYKSNNPVEIQSYRKQHQPSMQLFHEWLSSKTDVMNFKHFIQHMQLIHFNFLLYIEMIFLKYQLLLSSWWLFGWFDS